MQNQTTFLIFSKQPNLWLKS